jgi:hypothetical protein
VNKVCDRPRFSWHSQLANEICWALLEPINVTVISVTGIVLKSLVISRYDRIISSASTTNSMHTRLPRVIESKNK